MLLFAFLLTLYKVRVFYKFQVWMGGKYFDKKLVSSGIIASLTYLLWTLILSNLYSRNLFGVLFICQSSRWHVLKFLFDKKVILRLSNNLADACADELQHITALETWNVLQPMWLPQVYLHSGRRGGSYFIIKSTRGTMSKVREKARRQKPQDLKP